MSVKSGQEWAGIFVCKDATGALAAPSVGPAGVLYVNGTPNGAEVTISGSNPYKFSVTLPALEPGDCVSMYITATISSIATAAVVAEDVVDTKRVSDLQDAAAAPSAAENADAVWDEAIADHVTPGSFGPWASGLVTAIVAALTAGATYLAAIAAGVWAYATRTSTQSAAAVTTAVVGSTVTIHRGDTVTISLTGLGNISTRTKLWFTVKDSVQDHDTQSKVMVRENVGLIYVNGMTPTQAGLTTVDAALNVTDETTGAVTIILSAALTAMLTPDTGLVYDIQMLTTSGVTTLTSSTATVVGDVTQAIS